MRRERVAALVPHYRCEKWLDHCLASLGSQSRRLDAVIVIDDASPEAPRDIVRRHRGVTLLRAAANVGPYRLIQQVIDGTGFDWYLLQDADDWSAPDRLERLLAAANETGASLLGSDYLMLCIDEASTVMHPFPLDANAALAAAPTCHALQHPTSLVRRDLVERLGGYSSGMRFSGDDEFLRRASHLTTVVNVPRVLYFRRHRADSLTTSPLTGHGSASRRSVLQALAHRARANAEAAARGEPVCLEPFATAAPVDLAHAWGPRVLGVPPRSRRPPAVGPPARHTAPTHRRRLAHRPPIFVVGGPASGADALAWSLGQHRRVVPVVDLGWLAPLFASVVQADGPSALRQVPVSATRDLRPLDAVGKRPEDLRAAVAEAVHHLLFERLGAPGAGAPLEDRLRAVASGVPPGTERWIGLLPADTEVIKAALTLFPEALLLHIVRDVEDAVAALVRRSKANPDPLPPGDAYDAWLAAVRVGLDAERRFGATRVTRVRFDELTAEPEATIARCLSFLGLEWDGACRPPLEGLELVEASPAPGDGADGERDPARELSHALCGPPLRPRPSGDESLLPEAPSPPASGTASPPHPVEGPAALLRVAVPTGSVVAAVTKGDPAFTELDGLSVRHFPQGPDGEWAGYHPATCADIVSELASLQGQGVGYFLIPYWARWWLDHYEGLAEVLATHARLVADSADGGSLFALDDLGAAQVPAALPASRPASEAPVAQVAAAVSPLPGPGGGSRGTPRPKVTVISWNTTHNPLGRAYVLAALLAERFEVELVGARFEHFGTEVWSPLRDMEIPLRTFPGGDFPAYHRSMEAFVASIDADAIVVSKPRLPSYALGLMAKEARSRPLILDVDDWELSFVGGGQARSLGDLRSRRFDEAFLNPYGRLWTEHCEALVGSADALTVSNETLRDRYGGTIVPHARDERLFDPYRIDRDAARGRLGFAPEDRVVLFGGTPRKHKGIVDLARALAEIGDPRVRMCVIDAAELAGLEADLAPYASLVRRVPYHSFAAMPELLAAADLVAVLQDPASAVSRFQMPAKVTDALAMAVPCVVNAVPPLEPLLSRGHLEPVGEAGLAATVAAVLADLESARGRAARGREVFLAEMSFGAVRPRLEAVVERVLADTPPLGEEPRAFLQFARECFAPPVARPPAEPAGCTPPVAGVRPAASRQPFDVVMFWKQNDTGIYGRRHDMLMEQLARSERVRQVVQFDAPLDAAEIARVPPDGPTHAPLVRDRTLSRLGGYDSLPNLHHHSFLYSTDPDSFLPDRDEFPLHVKEALGRHGVGEVPVVFWVYPKLFEFPELARSLGPDVVVADVVDDHRTWLRAGAAAEIERVRAHYAEIGAVSDLVLTNCEAMRATMASLAPNVHLIPNGADYPSPDPPGGPPPELAGLPRPVAGYLGNLSARLDVALLEHLARARPDVSLVFVGSAHAGRDVLRLSDLPNVTFVGPRPYEEAKRFVRAFDVGLIPHLDDPMTRAMHPLKAFVYCALGVPTVSTDIANLDELRPLISVARDRDDFLAKVGEAVARPRRGVDAAADAMLRANAWSQRAARVIELVDEQLDLRGARV